MIKYCLVYILFFFLVSCEIDSNTNKENSANNDSKFELKDSIVVKYLGDIQITDYREDKQSYIGLDLSTGSILQFNKNGDILYEPIKTGEGPEFVTGTIYSVGYSGSNSLFAQTRTALYELNFNGDIIKEIGLPSEKLYTFGRYRNATIGNDALLLHHNNTDLRPKYREYFNEVNHITVVDLDSVSINYVISYEEESMYKNGDYYYRYSIPAFSVNKVDSSLNIVYPYERKIYQYSYSHGYKLKNIINTKPENFKEPEKAEFASELHLMRSLAYDSYYLNIFNNSKYIILEYVTGMPKTVSLPKSIPDLNNLMIDHNNRYYEIFKDGKKIGNDIEQPEGMMDLKYFHENNQAVFQLDKRKTERDYEVFYLYEVTSL